MTWRRSAFVDINAAILSRKSRTTRTGVIVGTGCTRPAVSAWFSYAIIDLVLTQPTDKSWYALATKLIDKVDASRTVQARIPLTVIDVSLAAFSDETEETAALVSVESIGTGAAVQARIWGAVVDLGLAIGTRVSRRAMAKISLEGMFLAGRTVEAGSVPARL